MIGLSLDSLASCPGADFPLQAQKSQIIHESRMTITLKHGIDTSNSNNAKQI